LRGSSGNASPAPSTRPPAPRACGDHDRGRAQLPAAGQHDAGRGAVLDQEPRDGLAFTHLRARGGGAPRERPRDRARIALQIARDVQRAVQRTGQRGLAREHLRGGKQRAVDARGLQAPRPRGLGRPGPRAGVRDERALAADPRRGAHPALHVVVDRQREHRQLELGPGVLVRAQHVALAEPRRAAADLPRVEQGHPRAAQRQLPRRRDTDDAGADDDRVEHQRCRGVGPRDSQGEAGREGVVGVQAVLRRAP
jgi:hypothetical protein